MSRRVMRRSWAMIALFPAVLVAIAGEGRAGVIFGVANVSPNATVNSITTPDPNNDDTVGPSPNTVESEDDKDEKLPPPPPPPDEEFRVQFEFDVMNSGGVTEYFFTETVTNAGMRTWTAFQHQLGFGFGSAFVRSLPGDGLDFDTSGRSPPPTSTAFTLVAHLEDLLVWSGGTFAPGDVVVLTYSIDVPDASVLFPPSSLTPDGYSYTLQTCVPPEPSTIVMTATAGLVLLFRKRSRSLRAPC